MEYYIYQKTGTAEYEKVGTVTDVKTYTVTNLKPKTAYTFAVSAWNGLRESAKSGTITSAKITITVYEALVTVTGLKATGTTATGTVLSWA